MVESLKPNPKIAIIILNWNGWRDTIECLESLRGVIYDNFDMIIVDNASSDESVQKITEYSSGRQFVSYSREEAENAVRNESRIKENQPNRKMTILRNEKNFGFAEGNNIGIRYVMRTQDPDFVLLLNNDTVVDLHFLDELVKIADSDDRIAVLGPKIYFYDYEGEKNFIQSVGGRVNWFLYPGYHNIGAFEDSVEGESAAVKERDYISGAAMMIKATYLREDLLDSSFFFGCEDVDFCLRIKKKGGRIVCCERSHIWHKVGISRNKNPDLRIGGGVKSLSRQALYNLKLTKKATRGYAIYIPIQLAHIGFKILRKKVLKKEHTPIFNYR